MASTHGSFNPISPSFADVRVLLLLPAGLIAGLFLAGCSHRPPPLPPPTTSAPGVSQPAPAPAAPLPLPEPELTVRMEPEMVRAGESALLSWEAKHADRVLIDHNIGAVETSGRIKFFPERSTTYQVIAVGPGGRTARHVTIRVSRDGRATVEENLKPRSVKEEFERFVKPVFFAYDSSELSQAARLTLDGNIRWLNSEENRGLRFIIQGHCDERGTEEYNLALGDRRAQAVAAYLRRHGVEASRMVPISLGEERPFDRRSTEEAWALNRRAHFVLIPETH